MKEDIDKTWMEVHGGFAKDMTLRDHFAGLAMQTWFAMQTLAHKYSHAGDVSRNAYILADAMLKAREAK
jgi:hypothetical protein